MTWVTVQGTTVIRGGTNRNLAEPISAPDEVWRGVLVCIWRKEDLPKRLPERVNASSKIHVLQKVELSLVKTHVVSLVEVDQAGVESTMIRRR